MGCKAKLNNLYIFWFIIYLQSDLVIIIIKYKLEKYSKLIFKTSKNNI